MNKFGIYFILIFLSANTVLSSTPLCLNCAQSVASGPPQPSCTIETQDCPKEIKVILAILENENSEKFNRTKMEQAKDKIDKTLNNERFATYQAYLKNLRSWIDSALSN